MGVRRRLHAQLPDPAGEGQRVDPEVAEALRAARVDQLALPTLADGESWRDIRGFVPDADALGRQGMAFERLDQLALEHLYGIR
jgi:xylose isomerase